MVPAEGAHTNDCHTDWTFVSQSADFPESWFNAAGYHSRVQETKMGRAFGFVTLIIVVAVGAYIYMRQAQSLTTPGNGSPASTVDLMGVRNDLLAIAQAERSHAALQGGYASIETLRSQGELAMQRDSRGPYAYSAEIGDSSFRIIATYSGPRSAGAPRTISIDQTMQISQE
jgi:hypothetical protein